MSLIINAVLNAPCSRVWGLPDCEEGGTMRQHSVCVCVCSLFCVSAMQQFLHTHTLISFSSFKHRKTLRLSSSLRHPILSSISVLPHTHQHMEEASVMPTGLILYTQLGQEDKYTESGNRACMCVCHTEAHTVTTGNVFSIASSISSMELLSLYPNYYLMHFSNVLRLVRAYNTKHTPAQVHNSSRTHTNSALTLCDQVSPQQRVQNGFHTIHLLNDQSFPKAHS